MTDAVSTAATAIVIAGMVVPVPFNWALKHPGGRVDRALARLFMPLVRWHASRQDTSMTSCAARRAGTERSTG